uniref:Uncharacterized protein n=1 Tax=Globodera rostochiensis TaxID=31243 RepID=A0A914IDS9_GLORO
MFRVWCRLPNPDRMKSEWPTAQLDNDWDRTTVQFARDNGIPLDADGRLDMEKIVRKEMVTEMADKFGILECTIRPISAVRNEKLESDSSKMNSSRSINNIYRKSRINISDQESAAATQFESSSKTETSGSKNYKEEISRKYGRRATRKFIEQSSDHSDRQELETFHRKRTSRRGETPTKHYDNKTSASGSKSSKYVTAGDEQQSSDEFYQRQKPAHQTSRRKFGNKTPKKYGTEESSSSFATSSDSSVERQRAHSLPKKHRGNITKKMKEAAAIPPAPPAIGSYETTDTFVPPFLPNSVVDSSSIPAINCEKSEHLNDFVRILYSFRLKNSKVLRKTGPNQLVFNLSHLLTNDSEWDAIERPLDDVQLGLAQENLFSTKMGKRGHVTLDMVDFITNAHVRLVAMKTPQIRCTIVDERRQESSLVNETSSNRRPNSEEKSLTTSGGSSSSSTELDETPKASSKHIETDQSLKSSTLLSTNRTLTVDDLTEGKSDGDEDEIWYSFGTKHRYMKVLKKNEQIGINLYRFLTDESTWDELEVPLNRAQKRLAKRAQFELRQNKRGQYTLNISEIVYKFAQITLHVEDFVCHVSVPKEERLVVADGKSKNGSTKSDHLSMVEFLDSVPINCEGNLPLLNAFVKIWLSMNVAHKCIGKMGDELVIIELYELVFGDQQRWDKLEKALDTAQINFANSNLIPLTIRADGGKVLDMAKIAKNKNVTELALKTNKISCRIGNIPVLDSAPHSRTNKECPEELKENKKQNLDHATNGNENAENISPMTPKKSKFIESLDCQIAHDLMKNWSKISKIAEILKWNGLRDVLLSLRQRKSAMVNAWRRVNEFRNCELMDDLVQRAVEAFEAVDKFLDALKLIEIGENLKEEFEKLDGDGETELNQEVVQLTNNPEWELAEFTNYEMNQLFNRQTSLVIVSLNAVEEAKIMLSAMRKAVSENKHEIQGGIWDQSQNRKFELPKAIYDYVKEKNVNGATGRLLAFLDELYRVNQFDSIKKFVDQIDVYRDDPREEVHELWRKFTQGIDWVQRLNYGRKLVQFVLYLHRLVPKYSEMNALKETTKMEQSAQHQPSLVTGKETMDEVHSHAKEKGTAAGTSGLKGFKNLELETIYRKIKQQMFDQFQVWWKKVPEQKEPLYEFYKQLDDISTRYVLSIVDAFFDGIPIENFRNEYSLGIKDFKIAKERGRAEAESSENDLYSIPSVAVYKSELPDKLSNHNSGRFNQHNFLTKFDDKSSKNMQITAFITKGLGSVFNWSKRFINELVAVTGNDFDELSPLYFYEVSSKIDSNGKKKKLRKPLPPVLNKNKLATIVKVIKLYEQKFNNKNISQMSDQKILEVHWRVMRQKWEAAAVGRQRARESLSRTSSTAEDTLQMLVINAEVQMNEQERKESLDKIEALVRSKRLLMFAIVLRRKYAKVEAEDAKAATSFGTIDTAYFEALRDIRREVERWVPRRREMKRLYRVCRQLNRAERIEISKLIDAFLNGKSVDKYLQKRQKKSGQSVEGKGAKNDVEVKP